MSRVIVVGAGFAGLSAATELAQADADVVVLEARDRVGGRVWSQQIDGNVIERGGEFVLSGYEMLRDLASRHGLEIADTGMSYYVREPRGVDGVDVKALGQAGATVASVESAIAQANGGDPCGFFGGCNAQPSANASPAAAAPAQTVQ